MSSTRYVAARLATPIETISCGDGVLNEDEIPSTIKTIWKQYDKNGDDLLSLDEYKALYRDVTSQMGGGGNAGITRGGLTAP
jgi:hypothetical protein